MKKKLLSLLVLPLALTGCGETAEDNPIQNDVLLDQVQKGMKEQLNENLIGLDCSIDSSNDQSVLYGSASFGVEASSSQMSAELTFNTNGNSITMNQSQTEGYKGVFSQTQSATHTVNTFYVKDSVNSTVTDPVYYMYEVQTTAGDNGFAPAYTYSRKDGITDVDQNISYIISSLLPGFSSTDDIYQKGDGYVASHKSVSSSTISNTLFPSTGDPVLTVTVIESEISIDSDYRISGFSYSTTQYAKTDFTGKILSDAVISEQNVTAEFHYGTREEASIDSDVVKYCDFIESNPVTLTTSDSYYDAIFTDDSSAYTAFENNRFYTHLHSSNLSENILYTLNVGENIFDPENITSDEGIEVVPDSTGHSFSLEFTDESIAYCHLELVMNPYNSWNYSAEIVAD